MSPKQKNRKHGCSVTCDVEAEAVAVFRVLMVVEAKIKNSIEAEVEADKVEAALKASTSIYIQWSFNRAHPLIRQSEYSGTPQ